MEKITVPIRGMHCKSCELLIEGKLKEIKEVKKAEVSHTSGKAKIWYEGKAPSQGAISKAVETAGYAVGESGRKHWFSRNMRDYYYLVNAAGILFLLFVLSQMFGISNISAKFSQQSIAMAGVIGLVAGVSSCMALIGGLVLALSARHSELHPEATVMQKFRPHLFFNLGRVAGFALFGGLIGLIGSALQLSPKALNILTLIVGGVMVLLGLKLIEIFPVLERVTITLPKFISQLLGIKRDAKEYSHTSAVAGGALTFFLPCGFTQAMQLYAMSTGSFAQGALIMSLFALGTVPGLLGIGGLSSIFKGAKARLFFATAGLAVILLGIFNISNAARIVFPKNATVDLSDPANAALQSKDVQIITTFYHWNTDITPSQFTVKSGQRVKMIVDVQDQGSGCMSTIMIPGLYNKVLSLDKGEQLTMEFVPNKKGKFAITCAMGVKRGYINVE